MQKLIDAANRVWAASLKYGPVDNGTPEGDEFDDALLELRLEAKNAGRKQPKANNDLEKALTEIVRIGSGKLPRAVPRVLIDAINEGSAALVRHESKKEGP
jgi:hypothetical protein